MSVRKILPLMLFLCCVCAITDAVAARRGVRVDFGTGWPFPGSNLGSADCPGSSTTSPLLTRDGITFAGINNNAYVADTYCQPSTSDFSGASLSSDEAGLAALIGTNTDHSVTAIRYTYLNAGRFEGGVGFQWAFYAFDNGVTIVGLYGLVDSNGNNVAINSTTSFIRRGGTTYWGGNQGHDDEYFCFVDGNYVGIWSGDLGEPGSACLAPFATLFADGFE